MNIDEQCFDNFDLNLIVTFLVLFREQSVSKTALRLKVSQPAVSNSLARLRLRFNDPLFLRAGRGVRPTPEAIKMAETLMPAIRSIETVLTIVFRPVSLEASNLRHESSGDPKRLKVDK